MFNFVKSLVKTFAIGIGVSMMVTNSIDNVNFSNTNLTEVVAPIDGIMYKTRTFATTDGSFNLSVRTIQKEDEVVHNAEGINHTRWYNLFILQSGRGLESSLEFEAANSPELDTSKLIKSINTTLRDQVAGGRVTQSIYDSFGKFLGIKYKLLEKQMMKQEVTHDAIFMGRNRLSCILRNMECVRQYIQTYDHLTALQLR